MVPIFSIEQVRMFVAEMSLAEDNLRKLGRWTVCEKCGSHFRALNNTSVCTDCANIVQFHAECGVVRKLESNM
jgi:hypothetical protein